MKNIVFIDTEVSETQKKAVDFGAVDEKNKTLHTGLINDFHEFISDAEYICGHNIINHDSKYIRVPEKSVFIDTLYISPVVFPDNKSYALSKDEKFSEYELNNPLSDSIKAMELLYDEANAFNDMDNKLKSIYYMLLKDSQYFSGFFRYTGFSANIDVKSEILDYFKGSICENAPLDSIISDSAIELAYCLALISLKRNDISVSAWVRMNYPKVDSVLRLLRGTSCGNCIYCKENLNPLKYLDKYFGYNSFIKYDGEPLQEKAVNHALENKSLLAIFPTGGGKSLTFQIPALMKGATEKALTVVISPLQSLMNDQVSKFEEKGIAEAVTINGSLSPLERAEVIERIESGIASILYISPELLRSVTIERLLLKHNIARFVIDEAHCFSSWGQDFRVEYLYIGDFIRELQEKKGDNCQIPVSCFTATAKQKVISDIKKYFFDKLNINLELFSTDTARKNLRYEVIYCDDENTKYDTLRTLIESRKCPTIIYVSRTKKTREIAERLCADGFGAKAFNGKMDKVEKKKNQKDFIDDKDDAQIMVATSAFGMGVDKSNVGLVIHYDISDSLENYVQEAGRAGRGKNTQAECYVLYNDNDLDKHFNLFNQTKLSVSEINQVWKAVKTLTKTRPEVCCSPLEIARQAGWDDNINDIETRIKTALQALENAGYIKRGKNMPRIYAQSIVVKNMMEASERISKSSYFESDEEREKAIRIIKSLISKRSISVADNEDAESRIDYIAEILGLEKADVIDSVQRMRKEGLLADGKDLTAYINKDDTQNKSTRILKKFRTVEKILLENADKNILEMNHKELNELVIENGAGLSSLNNTIRTLFYYWTIRKYITKNTDEDSDRRILSFTDEIDNIIEKRQKSYDISEFIIQYLFENSENSVSDSEEVLVGFSVLELLKAYKERYITDVSENEIEEALLFLSKIGAIKLDGGFLVIYSGMNIKRLIPKNTKKSYTKEDYRQLNEFYKNKIQQIHIIGEFANMMLKDYNLALEFVSDYFQMEYKKFLSKYFSKERKEQIENSITPAKYKKIFGELSPKQHEIIKDKDSKYIVVAAAPGSGKTMLLVHKLASLLLTEDVKHEQLLMLTFSRAAVTEFRQRLRELIGNNFIQVSTFHSYCFDLLNRIGNLNDSENVVKDAVELIRSEEVDLSKITKTVLVIDEAQDMDYYSFEFVKELMKHNEEMRVIAVGDDDQNIYGFRGSDSKYLRSLVTEYHATQYSLLDNYRSCKDIVNFSNVFAGDISERMKTENVKSVSNQKGEVVLIKHSGKNIETAVVNDIKMSAKNGSTCILTSTNLECFMIMGILRQNNIPAKFIQSRGKNFDLYNIAEIRYFINKVSAELVSPIISDSQWNNALDLLKEKYEKSASLSIVLDILNAFSENNPKKYMSDFIDFLHESNLENFYKVEQNIVTVSTIHKAKGREFDNVYMMVNNYQTVNDSVLHKLYVGITRAKNILHIHYTGNLFDKFAGIVPYTIDKNSYSLPKEITLELSMTDVYLDHFKEKKQFIFSIPLDTHFTIRGNSIYMGDNEVIVFSGDFYKHIKELKQNGYKPSEAFIKFICAWKSKGDIEETAVILPDVVLRLGKNKGIIEQEQEIVETENLYKISEIANEINEQREQSGREKILIPVINDWLESKKYLTNNSLSSRFATPEGNAIGITSEIRFSQKNEAYYLNYFTENGRQFVLDNVLNIESFKDKKDFEILEYPSGMSLDNFIKQNRNKYLIISTERFDNHSKTGSYYTCLIYNEHKKILEKSGIDSSCAGMSTLMGILDAVNQLLLSKDVIIMSAFSLEFGNPSKSNKPICKEILKTLKKKECDTYITVCNKTVFEVEEFIKKL